MFPDLEFIKTMLNGLRSRIEKVEKSISRVAESIKSSTADWNQNDPDALDYVKGRTHYEANGKVVQLPPKFLPSPTSNTVGAIKADTVKTTDIQPVRLGTDGKLYSSGIPVFTTSGTGSHYTATVPEITNLVKGMLVVMIPHTDSTTQYPGLTINGGDIKTISRPVSTGGKSTFIYRPNLKSGIPYLLIYSDSEWLSINNVRPDGLDLLNYVSPSNGGTGLTSLTKGSYIIGNGRSSVQQKTPSEVLADIGAIPVPATASVGQVLAVKAVGENAKPTEWEPVDIPTALPNPNALTFTGAVTGSYDGSVPITVNIPDGGSVSGGCTFLLATETTEEVSAVNWSLPINWDKIIQLNIYADVPSQDADLALYAFFGGKNYKSIGTLTAGNKNGIDLYILRTSSDFCTIGTAIVKSYPENAKPVMPTQVIYMQSGQNTLRLYSNTSGVNFPVGTKFVIWGVYVHENP